MLAGEDIGLADPQALLVAAAAVTVFEFIGMPEGIYPIAEATLYLASAPKSNSAGAIFSAQKWIEEHGLGAVTTHLMDSNRDAKGLGHGQGYLYPHEFPAHFVAQQYLQAGVQGSIFYKPSDQGYEKQILERLQQWRKAQAEGLKQAVEKNANNRPDPARK